MAVACGSACFVRAHIDAGVVLDPCACLQLEQRKIESKHMVADIIRREEAEKKAEEVCSFAEVSVCRCRRDECVLCPVG